jgi:large subunit ribosomal protein L9
MKVVLTKEVPRLGTPGDVKEVADGYARNYLFPRGLAVQATAQALTQAEQLRKVESQRKAKQETELQTLASRLVDVSIAVKAKVGEEGTLYGSVTNTDVAAELEAVLGVEVDKRRVELEEPLKKLGQFQIPVRVGPNKVVHITVNVEPQEGE